MKTPGKLIIASVTLALYLIGTVGVGIYYCQCKNEKQIALFEQHSCLCKQKEVQSNQETCAESKGCCQHSQQHTEKKQAETSGCGSCECSMVTVVSLDDNQLAAETLSTKFFSQLLSVIGIPVSPIDLFLTQADSKLTDESPPLVYPNKPSIYQTCQLRL